MGYLTTTFCQVDTIGGFYRNTWKPIMKTSFIDVNKPFGLCSICTYIFILVIMIVVIYEWRMSKMKRFGPKECKVSSCYHKNQDSSRYLEIKYVWSIIQDSRKLKESNSESLVCWVIMIPDLDIRIHTGNANNFW